MTYLAVEISLYLASAALIGLFVGWLFWGRSYHRQAAKFHEEMTTSLEEERLRSSELKRDLDDADAKLKKELDAEKVNSAKALVEVQGLLDSEREASRLAKAATEKLRHDMETAISAERTLASSAVEEATQHVESLKGSIEEAKARETKIQAELEELRLLAGAEKLAAQSARAEVEDLRRDMQASLDAERETSQAARRAVDDIQATLARTFGENAGIVAAIEAQATKPAEVKTAISSDMEKEPEDLDGGDQDDPVAGGHAEDADLKATSKSFGIDAEPGTAFDVSEEEAEKSALSDQIEDPSAGVDAAPDKSDPSQISLDGQPQPSTELEEALPTPSEDHDQPITFDGKPPERDVGTDQDGAARPASLLNERPDEVDNLQEIGGVDSDTEKLLNEQGCYQFKQLAHFSANDIDWLVQQLPDLPDLKQRIEQDGWIEQARELQIKKYMATNANRPRWWSRTRLQ